MTHTSCMELLERQEALADMTRLAREAGDGHGGLVLLCGEAGVGKTAVLEQFQRDLPAARWSWGACDSLFTPRPLGPLFDLAGQLGGELDRLCRTGGGREELFSALLRQVSDGATLMSSSSRTSTGPTRPQSTCCGSSGGASRALARS